MSDLIKRLRHIRGSFVIPIEAPDVFGWADEAADRIEELEAALDHAEGLLVDQNGLVAEIAALRERVEFWRGQSMDDVND